MVDVFALYVDLATRYWWVLLIGGGAVMVYFLFFYKSAGKPALKSVNRAEVERKKFLRRMDSNNTKFKTIIQDGQPRLFIDKFQPSEFKSGDTTKKVFEFIARKPTFILGWLLPLFSRQEGYIFNADNIYYDTARPTELSLKLGVTLWDKLGIFYDNTLTESTIEAFTREFTAQTDYENLSAEYYAASQEASVIDRDRAHMTLSDHLTLEQIKEKKRVADLTG